MITYTPPAATVKVRNGLNIVNGFIEMGGPLIRDTHLTGTGQTLNIDINDGNSEASFNITNGTINMNTRDSSGISTSQAVINMGESSVNMAALGQNASGDSQSVSIGVNSDGQGAFGYQNNVTGNQQSLTINPDNGIGIQVVDTQTMTGLSFDQIYSPDLNSNFGLNVPAGGQFAPFERVVASLTSITQNASIPDYLVYTDSTYSSLMICAWLQLYGAGTILLTVDFTDIQGAAQTVAFPLASGAGFFALNPILIACQGAKDVNVNVINTGGVTYDIAVIIMASQNN